MPKNDRKFGQRYYKRRPHHHGDGEHIVFLFPNGWGASVVPDESYMGRRRTIESEFHGIKHSFEAPARDAFEVGLIQWKDGVDLFHLKGGVLDDKTWWLHYDTEDGDYNSGLDEEESFGAMSDEEWFAHFNDVKRHLTKAEVKELLELIKNRPAWF